MNIIFPTPDQRPDSSINPSPKAPPPKKIEGIFVSENGKEFVIKPMVIQNENGIEERTLVWIQFLAYPPTILDKITGVATPILKTGKAINEDSDEFAPIRELLDRASDDLIGIPLDELKVGLHEILTLRPSIETSDYKTTVLTIAERVAQSYFAEGNRERAMEIRMKAATLISPSGELGNLLYKLENEDPKLGQMLYPLDTSVFKNQTLAVQKQLFDNEAAPRLHVEGKVSHYVRKNLNHTLEFAKNQPKEFLAALPENFCSDFTVSSEFATYYGRMPNGRFSSDISENGYDIESEDLLTLHFHGVGKVQIGESTTLRSHYNRISIDLDPGVPEEDSAAKLHIILAALGLGVTSSSPRKVDEERIKVMQLFRAFYPAQAYSFEQSEETFIEPVNKLRNRIIAEVPDMDLKFKEYLEDHPDRMYQQEVLPGQYIWAVKGLAEEVRENGGIGLMSSIGGDTVEDSFKRFVTICKGGALSSEGRFQRGIIVAGTSSDMDLAEGGADSVFTRLITKNMNKDPRVYVLNGRMNILWDLDLVERVGYAYHQDICGTKEPSQYDVRPSILELTQLCQESPDSSETIGNEVCIHKYIPARYIKGAVVRTRKDKQDLIDVLRTEDLIVMNADGIESIFGKPIDQFIHVGNFKKSQWR